MAQGEFLVSVCDAYLKNTVSDSIVVRAKALLNSALKIALSQQEVRGGFGNVLQYIYMHSKKLDVTLENAEFDETYIALNSGTVISNDSQDVFFEENVTLTAGSGTTTNTPVGNVYVQSLDGGAITTITPTGKTFSVAGGGSNTYRVMYRYADNVDNFVIDAGALPGSFELVLLAKVFKKNAGQVATLEITVPSYQLDGTVDLSFSASGVSTGKLSGFALADGNNAYAMVRRISMTGDAVTYSALAASPGSVTLATTTGTQQLTVFGIRGGAYAPSNITTATGITYTSSATGTATVSSGGLITGVATGTTYITIAYQGLTDVVEVTVP